MSLSVKEILNIGQRRLQDAGVSDAALDSKLLYCFMTGITSGRLFIMYHATNTSASSTSGRRESRFSI